MVNLSDYYEKKDDGPVVDIAAVVLSAVATWLLSIWSGLVSIIQEWGRGYSSYLEGFERGIQNVLGTWFEIPSIGVAAAFADNARWLDGLGLWAAPVAAAEAALLVVGFAVVVRLAWRRVLGAF